MTAQRIADVAALALLAVGAGGDLFRRRVPNAIAVTLFAGGVAAQAAIGGWRAAAWAAAVALTVGAALFVPWSMRVVGGGDLKLAAGAAACMGSGRIAPFLAATALAGGVLAIPFLRGPRATWNEVVVGAAEVRVGTAGAPARERARRVPLAVAIAAGAAAALAVG